MQNSKKFFFYLLFFALISTLFLFDVYTKFNNERTLLNKEKKVIHVIDNYHNLDILLKEKRGLSQIDNPKVDLKIQQLNKDILLLAQQLNNKKIFYKIDQLLNNRFDNRKNLFYEYTKIINLLNFEKISFINASKYIFKQKNLNYLFNAIFIYDLPSMIENIGKIRGLGSAILQSSTVDQNDFYVLQDNFNSFGYNFNKFIKYVSVYRVNQNKTEMKLLMSLLKASLEQIQEGTYSKELHEYFYDVSLIIETLNYHYKEGKSVILKSIDKEIVSIDKKLTLYFVCYIIFFAIMYFVIFKAYRVRHFSKLRAEVIKKERHLMTKIHNRLYAYSELKPLCDQLVNILLYEFSANETVLYMYDKKNLQMNLISTCGISQKNVAHVLALRDNDVYKSLYMQKILIKDNQFFVPIIFEYNILATLVCTFSKKVKKRLINKKSIQLVANYIYKVQQSEENKKYFNLIDNYVLTSSTNKEGLITYVSNALCKNTGYKKEELIGRSHSMLKDPTFDKQIYEELWSQITSGETYRGDIRNIKKDGTAYWLDVIITPEFGFYGDIIGYDSVRYDITSKKQVEELAIKDGLTNIYNRRFFDEIFDRQVQNIKREEGYLVFALLDIDFFKQYNDTYGHSLGDEVLKKVALSLQLHFKRTGDFVFRLGGEEFGILFKCKSKQSGLNMVEHLLTNENIQAIEHKKSTVSSHLTFSIGVYFIDQTCHYGSKKIYEMADHYLYEVKKSGRNNFKSNLCL